jgi:hypothetical protein
VLQFTSASLFTKAEETETGANQLEMTDETGNSNKNVETVVSGRSQITTAFEFYF